MEGPREISCRPNVPRGKDQKKDQQVLPMKERPESQTRLTVKNSQQKKNGHEVDQTEHTFTHRGEGRANPEGSKPNATMLAALVATDCTKNSGGYKSAKDRLGHNNSP